MSELNSAAARPVLKGALQVISFAALSVAMVAQTATPATPATNNPSASTNVAVTTDEKVIVLDPFSVKADESGYRASNSVVATGFNRDIEHTPLTINVLTEDFIRDAGLNSYAEVSQFMPNTYVVPDPAGLGSTANARGQATSYYTQDGVRYYTEPIVRLGARVEVIKGPATLFFGRAQPGGIFNFGTRAPSARREQSVVFTYGSFDKKSVDIGSQGKIDQAGKLIYRLDGSVQDNGSFIDNGYDKLKYVRGSLSYQIFDTLRITGKYEYSDRKQSGNPIGHSVIAQQYYTDYANPRAEQITWARTAYGLGAGPTNAAVADFLRGQWKENLANWIVGTQQAYISDPNNKDNVYPTYAVGLSGNLTPRGWYYNPAQQGTYYEKNVKTYGGDAIWTPNSHVAIKASYTKYDLLRPRLNIQLTEILADGNMRASNFQVREDQNDSTTMSLSALFDFDTGKIHHTTNIGGQYFKDYYRNVNGTLFGLNQVAGVKDPRTSAGANVAAGYNPQTDGYLDVTKFVQFYPSQVTPPAWAQNYENAYYFSHIAEFFDRKVGLLFGGRVQEYEVRNIPFKNTASLEDINTLGVTWNVTPNLVMFASRSKSFEPNINIFLVNGAGTTPAEQAANVHPPVTGTGYDFGVKFGLFNRKLVGQLSLFQTTRTNDAAFRATDLGRTNADPRNNDADQNNNVTWSIPGGERLSRGIELETTYQPNKYYSALITAGWLPVARVEENNAIPFITTFDGRRIRDPNQANFVGQRSPNSPRYTFAVWNHYKFPGTKWGAGVGGNYVSRVEIPNQSSYKVSAPSYVNLRAGVDYTQKLSSGEMRLSLNVNNLLNDRYFISFYRAEPIALTFRAEYSF